MTTDQIMGLARQLLPVVGGILIALGWITTDQWGVWTNIILQILGPTATIVGVVWSFIANSKSSILQSAAQMPEVKKIELDAKQHSAVQLEAVTPSNVIATP